MVLARMRGKGRGRSEFWRVVAARAAVSGVREGKGERGTRSDPGEWSLARGSASRGGGSLGGGRGSTGWGRRPSGERNREGKSAGSVVVTGLLCSRELCRVAENEYSGARENYQKPSLWAKQMILQQDGL